MILGYLNVGGVAVTFLKYSYKYCNVVGEDGMGRVCTPLPHLQ